MRGWARLAAASRRLGGWLSRTLVEPSLPLLAVEIRPRAVSAVRLTAQRGRLAVGAAGSTELPPGVLDISLTKRNVVDEAAFRAALRSVLERVGALSGGPISLVLPDPAVRVTLVPAEKTRGRRREAEETLRFRLHKALPFDIRSARLAWDSAGAEQTVVAVAADEVVRGYEGALEALGFVTGLVETTSLALTAAIAVSGSTGDRLLVNWDEGYVSFVVLRGAVPLLVRTLPEEDDAAAVARHAAGTLQFHRDRLGGQELEEVVLRSAALPGEVAAGVLEAVLGVAPRLVAPWAALGLLESGPATQAVAGAAACASRRAA